MVSNAVLFLKGIGVGLSISAPVGAIGTLCIRQALVGGFVLGLSSGLGAATADAVYGAIAGFGLTFLKDFLIHHQIFLGIAGGVFLLIMGIKTFLARTSTKEIEAQLYRPLDAYLSTFFLTLTNPLTLLAFTALFSTFDIDTTTYTSSLIFVGGVFTGSALWWLLLTTTISRFRSRISVPVINTINKISGTIISLFGGMALLRALSQMNFK